VFDIKRFLDSALPQMLSGNQPMLDEVRQAIDEAKAKTGIDVRQFETGIIKIGKYALPATQLGDANTIS
jgi:hypothetical protein